MSEYIFVVDIDITPSPAKWLKYEARSSWSFEIRASCFLWLFDRIWNRINKFHLFRPSKIHHLRKCSTTFLYLRENFVKFAHRNQLSIKKNKTVNEVYVVPVFEIHAGMEIPNSKHELLADINFGTVRDRLIYIWEQGVKNLLFLKIGIVVRWKIQHWYLKIKYDKFPRFSLSFKKIAPYLLLNYGSYEVATFGYFWVDRSRPKIKTGYIKK